MTCVLSSQCLFTQKKPSDLEFSACNMPNYRVDCQTLSTESYSGNYTGVYGRDGSVDSVYHASLEFLGKNKHFRALNGFLVRNDENILPNGDQKQGTSVLSNGLKQGFEDVEVRKGRKRKCRISDLCTLPMKRISPFFHTSQEEKAERRKLLKLSVEKLKETEDPERSLRRTVLVSNAMKQLQTEIRRAKCSRKWINSVKTEIREERVSENDFSALHSQRLQNCHILDDPFFSGENEKITDDMTEVLINNVLNYRDGEETEQVSNCISQRDLEKKETDYRFGSGG